MNAATRTKPSPRRNLSILIADDEPDTVAMLALVLHDEGHIIHTVINGTFALEAVRRYKPDVCILDIQMSGKNGYDLARDIRVEMGESAPMLIAISGRWTTRVDEFVAASVGFTHLLRKPADPQELIAVLNGYSEGEAA